MFTLPWKPKEPTPLDKLYDATVEQAAAAIGDPDKLEKTLNNVASAHKMKYARKDAQNRVSWDVIVTVTASLLGTILVLKFEEVNVLATKAVAWIPKIQTPKPKI